MRRTLLVWCLVGVLVRAAFLVLEPPVERMGDEPSWLSLAVHGLAERRHPLSPFANQLLFYPPLYPYFLALPYAVTGSHTAGQWIQVLVGGLLIPAVGLIAARCFSTRTGLLAAAIVALYPDLVWFAAHFWSETLFLTLLFWGIERALAAQQAASRPAAIAAGILLGLAALTRETALPFALLAAIWAAWPRPSGEAKAGRKRGAALLLATLLTIAPWTWRNWIVFGAFIPISTYGALNLWLGNTNLDRDEVYRLSDSVEGPVAQYHLAREKAVAEIARRQPLWVFEKTLREVPALLAASSEALVFIEEGAYGTVRAPARALAVAAIAVPWVALLLLGVPAFALFEATRARGLLLVFLGYYVLVHIAAFGHHRFHLPLIPVLAVFASALLSEPWKHGRFSLH